MKKYLLLVLALLFIIGCGRNYFEPNPKSVSNPIYVTEALNSPIIYLTKDTATLKNGEVLPTHKVLPKGFVAIDKDIAKNGYILRVDNKNITYPKLIVTAKKRDNLLAILFGDNHFELYNLDTNKTIASAKFGDFLASRKFIAQPYFYKDLLLIPTLDGKVAIFDLKQNKVIKNIVVSDKDYFNNIIYLGVSNDTLIMASRDKIIVISPNFKTEKKYNIKHILVDDKYIYLFTFEGDVKKLNFVLKPIKEVSFKYANIIYPMFYNNKIYFLSRGDKSFLISIDKNLSSNKIIPIKVYVDDDKCYKDMPIYLKTNVFGYDGKYIINDYILKVK